MRVVARFALVVSVTLVTLCPSWMARESDQAQQRTFRTYTINSGWGYYGAAFSPDDRLLAVIASKRSDNEDEPQIVGELQIWDFRDHKLVAEKVLFRRQPSKPEIRSEALFSLWGYTPSGSMIL